MRGGAKHAETAGAADRGHHVAAVTEGQQGKFNSQHVADWRFHGVHSLRQLLMLLVLFDVQLVRRLAHHRRSCQVRLVLMSSEHGRSIFITSSSAKADDPVFQSAGDWNRETAEYWIPAFAGMTAVPGFPVCIFAPCAFTPRVECWLAAKGYEGLR